LTERRSTLYLSWPSLGLQKPKIIDFSPLVTKYERRLIAASSFLNQAGRLQLTNSVITAMPTFAMCTFKLQDTVWNKLTSIGGIVFGEDQTYAPKSHLLQHGP